MQIVDPYLASYGAANPIFAVIQLAQTTMRSELGKMTLDKTFEERDALNENIVVCHLISNLKLFVYFPYDHIIAISMVKLHELCSRTSNRISSYSSCIRELL